jgi:hypothetical protein
MKATIELDVGSKAFASGLLPELVCSSAPQPSWRFGRDCRGGGQRRRRTGDLRESDREDNQ